MKKGSLTTTPCSYEEPSTYEASCQIEPPTHKVLLSY